MGKEAAELMIRVRADGSAAEAYLKRLNELQAQSNAKNTREAIKVSEEVAKSEIRANEAREKSAIRVDAARSASATRAAQVRTKVATDTSNVEVGAATRTAAATKRAIDERARYEYATNLRSRDSYILFLKQEEHAEEQSYTRRARLLKERQRLEAQANKPSGLTGAILSSRFSLPGTDGTVQPLVGRSAQALGIANDLAAAAAVTGAGIAAAIPMLNKFADRASDLNETLGKSSVVFGDSAKSIENWAKGGAKNFGLSQQKTIEATATLGNLLRATGANQAGLARMGKEAVARAADIASFNNTAGGAEEVLKDFQSGLNGEAEPLRKFGVQLTAARIEAEAFASGIAKPVKDADKIAQANTVVEIAVARLADAQKKYGANTVEVARAQLALDKAQTALNKAVKGGHVELTQGQKMAAAYRIILRDTSNQAGDFAKTAGGAANAQRTLNGEMEDAEAILGRKILPLKAQVLGFLNDMLDKFNNLSPATQDWLTKISGFGLLVAPFVAGVTKMALAIKTLRIQQELLNTAQAAGGATAASKGFLGGVAGRLAPLAGAVATPLVVGAAGVASVVGAVGYLKAGSDEAEADRQIAEQQQASAKSFRDAADKARRERAVLQAYLKSEKTRGALIEPKNKEETDALEASGINFDRGRAAPGANPARVDAEIKRLTALATNADRAAKNAVRQSGEANARAAKVAAQKKEQQAPQKKGGNDNPDPKPDGSPLHSGAQAKADAKDAEARERDARGVIAARAKAAADEAARILDTLTENLAKYGAGMTKSKRGEYDKRIQNQTRSVLTLRGQQYDAEAAVNPTLTGAAKAEGRRANLADVGKQVRDKIAAANNKIAQAFAEQAEQAHAVTRAEMANAEKHLAVQAEMARTDLAEGTEIEARRFTRTALLQTEKQRADIARRLALLDLQEEADKLRAAQKGRLTPNQRKRLDAQIAGVNAERDTAYANAERDNRQGNKADTREIAGQSAANLREMAEQSATAQDRLRLVQAAQNKEADAARGTETQTQRLQREARNREERIPLNREVRFDEGGALLREAAQTGDVDKLNEAMDKFNSIYELTKNAAEAQEVTARIMASLAGVSGDENSKLNPRLLQQHASDLIPMAGQLDASARADLAGQVKKIGEGDETTARLREEIEAINREIDAGNGHYNRRAEILRDLGLQTHDLTIEQRRQVDQIVAMNRELERSRRIHEKIEEVAQGVGGIVEDTVFNLSNGSKTAFADIGKSFEELTKRMIAQAVAAEAVRVVRRIAEGVTGANRRRGRGGAAVGDAPMDESGGGTVAGFDALGALATGVGAFFASKQEAPKASPADAANGIVSTQDKGGGGTGAIVSTLLGLVKPDASSVSVGGAANMKGVTPVYVVGMAPGLGGAGGAAGGKPGVLSAAGGLMSLASLIPGVGSGIGVAGAVLGGVGKIFGFANGGRPPVSVGGERGMEAFVSDFRKNVEFIGAGGPSYFRALSPGTIIPADKTAQMLRNGLAGAATSGGSASGSQTIVRAEFTHVGDINDRMDRREAEKAQVRVLQDALTGF